MKTQTMSALALGLVMTAGNTMAENAADHSGFTISPMLGYYNFDADREVKDEPFISLGLGYQFNSPWAIEFVYVGARTEDSRRDVNVDFDQYHLDGIYNFNRNGNFQTYLAAGIGESEFERRRSDHVETNINAGGGVKYFLNPKLSLRGDMRVVTSLDEEQTDFAVSLGLHYAFGGSSQAAGGAADSAGAAGMAVMGSASMADADQDGIEDASDQCPDTKAGAKVDEVGCYIMIKEGHSIALNINFANDSSDVTPQNYAEISKLADFMREYPQTSVVIEGHTDDTGSSDHNQGLSERRAKAVAGMLIGRNGISPSRIATRGYGESMPLFDSAVEGYREKNRRVVAVVNVTVEKIQE